MTKTKTQQNTNFDFVDNQETTTLEIVNSIGQCIPL